MTQSVKLYGFGSFFSSLPSAARDVDILIVHERVDSASIDFAIRCKMIFGHFLPTAHFTILSESEDIELSFIQQCNARMLGRVTDIEPDAQLAKLARLVELCMGPGLVPRAP